LANGSVKVSLAWLKPLILLVTDKHIDDVQQCICRKVRRQIQLLKQNLALLRTLRTAAKPVLKKILLVMRRTGSS